VHLQNKATLREKETWDHHNNAQQKDIAVNQTKTNLHKTMVMHNRKT
jgi:hypothetical protein